MATPIMLCQTISPGCLSLSVNFLEKDALIVVMQMLYFTAMDGRTALSSLLHIVAACGLNITHLS
jgi:hypothetical protein